MYFILSLALVIYSIYKAVEAIKELDNSIGESVSFKYPKEKKI